MEIMVTKHLELEHRYLSLIDACEDEMLLIEDAVESLADPLLRTIMRYKYIDCMTFDEIALRVHYSRQNITIKHKKALGLLRGYDENIIKNDHENDHGAFE